MKGIKQTEEALRLLEDLFPVVRAPLGAGFHELKTCGDRYVVSSKGLLLEVLRPWVHAVVPVTSETRRMVPFGPGPAIGMTLLCGLPPAELLERFDRAAKAASPRETAAWLTWNDLTQEWRYREVAILEHSADSVVYERPVLGAHEHLVVDMHSHGAHRAGFSSQDNRDDHGALQVSYCVGSLDRDAPTKAACARVLGVTLPGTSIRVGERHAASV